MKLFEEKIVAWQDENLKGEALAAFEKELGERLGVPVPTGKDTEWARVRALLVADSERGDAHLQHTDFFLSQFHLKLESTEAAVPSGREAISKPGRFLLGLPLFGWAGAALLILATIVSALVIPRGSDAGSATLNTAASQEPAEVLHAQVSKSGVSATTFKSTSAGSELTVLWLDGMEYVPSDWQIN